MALSSLLGALVVTLVVLGVLIMAGYGLVVLVFAVAVATLGDYWLRND